MHSLAAFLEVVAVPGMILLGMFVQWSYRELKRVQEHERSTTLDANGSAFTPLMAEWAIRAAQRDLYLDMPDAPTPALAFQCNTLMYDEICRRTAEVGARIAKDWTAKPAQLFSIPIEPNFAVPDGVVWLCDVKCKTTIARVVNVAAPGEVHPSAA